MSDGEDLGMGAENYNPADMMLADQPSKGVVVQSVRKASQKPDELSKQAIQFISGKTGDKEKVATIVERKTKGQPTRKELVVGMVNDKSEGVVHSTLDIQDYQEMLRYLNGLERSRWSVPRNKFDSFPLGVINALRLGQEGKEHDSIGLHVTHDPLGFDITVRNEDHKAVVKIDTGDGKINFSSEVQKLSDGEWVPDDKIESNDITANDVIPIIKTGIGDK